MKMFRLSLMFAASCFSAAAAGQDAMSYPPIEAPLYLECKVHEPGSSNPLSEWQTVVFYFPSGMGQADSDLEVVDPDRQLEGNVFDFSIVTGDHWSLVAKMGAPISSDILRGPTVTFLPPSGQGENFRMAYSRGGSDLAKSGVCFGMIGANAQAAFDKARQGHFALGS